MWCTEVSCTSETSCVLCRVLWHFQVQILAGKDKGRQGQVSIVMRPRNAVIVEGLNAVSTLVCVCLCVCACMHACMFE